MSTDITELIETLRQPKSWDDLADAKKQLIEIGEAVADPLVAILKNSRTRQGSIMEILRDIGYPANQPAVDLAIGMLMDPNGPGCEASLDLLGQIPDVAFPMIQEFFQESDDNILKFYDNYWAPCVLLERWGSPIIDSILPDLLRLLRLGNDENDLDTYALGPIRVIGSPKADVALPFIRKILTGCRDKVAKREAIEALKGFSPETIRELAPVLREYLNDDYEAVRSGAAELPYRFDEQTG